MLLIAGAIGVGTLAIGAGVVNAATATTAKTNSNPTIALAAAMAERFNLNRVDVQAVIDETMKAHRTSMEVKHQEVFGMRLSQAVTAGKLTQAQADLITAKAAELKATMETNRRALQTASKEQISARLDAEGAALKAWATANNIPEEFVRFAGGGKGFGGHGVFKNGNAMTQ